MQTADLMSLTVLSFVSDSAYAAIGFVYSNVVFIQFFIIEKPRNGVD